MKKISTVLSFVLISCALLACQSEPQTQTSNILQPQESTCDSFHKGDDISTRLGEGPLELKLPLARFKTKHRGVSTVLLPGIQGSIHSFWAYQNPQGKWAIADKQTVVRIQPGKLDAQLLHRLDSEVFPKIVLFLVLPQAYWDRALSVQPILEKNEARWGRLKPYTLQITAHGMFHPFRGLHEVGNSGDLLPQHLNRVINQIEPGSLYVPSRLSNNIQLKQPDLFNPRICPIAGTNA